MGADLINLRQARKRRERERQEAQAAANRAVFGQSKGAKALRRDQQALAERRLEGHRLRPPGSTTEEA